MASWLCVITEASLYVTLSVYGALLSATPFPISLVVYVRASTYVRVRIELVAFRVTEPSVRVPYAPEVDRL